MFALRSLGTRAVSAPRVLSAAPLSKRGLRQTTRAQAQQQGGNEGNVGIQRQGEGQGQRMRIRGGDYPESLMSSIPSMRRMSSAMEEMRRDMDSMMSSFGMRDPFALSFPSLLDPWGPDEDLTPNVIRRSFPVSMEEKDKSYVFTAEVPGLTPQDVKVTVDTDTRMLTISGQRQEEMTPEEQKGGATQRSSMSFVRSFRVPADVDLQSEKGAASASVKNGMLKLEMPKINAQVQNSTTKEIPVM
ncbi:HSP20-like chaperone [Dunaliella salina]|uniref:HSP20-like chaperone n=1 Tax=Dunaliella salina TaxID=3046 RepID=A0ABQ7GMH3_DUNSA|nr:HSP20-like chaperone [Dunaliella salina]|eukprot:KAF5835813.1 HSP20-like chaperone [Dunaliella salina]